MWFKVKVKVEGQSCRSRSKVAGVKVKGSRSMLGYVD